MSQTSQLAAMFERIPFQTIYGVETILVSLIKGEFDTAMNTASRLAPYYDAEDPMASWYNAEVIFNNINSSILTRTNLVKSVLDSTKTPKGCWNQASLYQLAVSIRVDALDKIFRLLNRAKIIQEQMRGTPIYQQLREGFTRELMLELAGVNTRSEYSTYIYNAMLLSVSWLLILGYDRRLLNVIELAFRHHTLAYMILNWKSSFYKAKWLKEKHEVESMFPILYNAMKGQLDPYLSQLETEEAPAKIEYLFPMHWIQAVDADPEKLPAPFLIVPRRAWTDGKPPRSGEIELMYPKQGVVPLFPRGNEPLINTIFGSTGSGKTILENALAMARLDRGGFGIRLELDRYSRLQSQMMGLKLSHRHPAIKWVTEVEHLQPRGCDIISLVVVENENDLSKIRSAPTKLDRLVYVQDVRAFELPWDRLYKRGRMLCVRFVSDSLTLRALKTILKSFTRWRESETVPCFIQGDEALTLASSKIRAGYGKASIRLSDEIDTLFRNVRGMGIALDMSTQRPADVIKAATTEMTDLFVSNLGEEDAEKVIAMLPSSADRKVIRSLLTEGRLSHDQKIKWFVWMSKRQDSVGAIRAIFPPCGAEVQDTKREDLFAEEGLLLPSWADVKKLTKAPLPQKIELLDDVERELEEKKLRGTAMEDAIKTMTGIAHDERPAPRKIGSVDEF
jgi:hypothetical protein